MNVWVYVYALPFLFSGVPLMLILYVYEGCRDGQGVAHVHRDGDPFDHEASCRVWNHSPTGFEWGYCGSGPAQLALAILLDHLSKDLAVGLHQKFKFEVVSAWRKEGFRLDSAGVLRWVADLAQLALAE